MSINYSHAIAFIFEGDTEKVFYLNMLEYFCSLHPNWKLQKNTDYSLNEKYYSIQTDAGIVLVKTYVVGTISQVANADTWFNKRCKSIDSLLSWTVFLCYDTDNYSANISKFYEGDWKELRKSLNKGTRVRIVDLAASADIEDIMLIDSTNVFQFIGISPVPIPNKRKGKLKMKALFRMKGRGSAYHEGSRAENLINSLDMNKIILDSPIPFNEIEKTILDLR